MENICINNGYFATKVKTASKEFMFESKVTKALDKYEANLILDGAMYKVGAGSNDLELDKTISFTQKACISYAIQKATTDNVRVMSALPINAYSNANAREDYKSWLLTIDKVKECEIYPEGAAATLCDLSWYKNKLVCLIDVGGLTANCMIFDNGNLVPSTAFSCQLGAIMLENRLRMALQQSELVNVPDYQLKYLTDKPQYKKVIDEYVAEIKQELKKMNYPTNIQYRFTGGGSIRYANVFRESFNDAYLTQDAVWENVRGLYLLSEVIWK